MAISSVVLRGFGNGTATGTIPLVVRQGYTAVVAAATTKPSVFRTGRWAPSVTMVGRWAPTSSHTGRWAPDIGIEA